MFTFVIMLISNTSTLVLLAKVDALLPFFEIAPQISIPQEVHIETIANPDSLDCKLIQRLIDEEKITIAPARPERVQWARENFRLHPGEAAAYALFDKSEHAAILTDDGELIKLCKLEQIPFLCALSVIIRLYEKKMLTRQEALDKLQLLQKIGRYAREVMDYYQRQVI